MKALIYINILCVPYKHILDLLHTLFSIQATSFSYINFHTIFNKQIVTEHMQWSTRTVPIK